MIKVELNEIAGFESAVKAMRNPMNSWDKSDSVVVHQPDTPRLDYHGKVVEIIPAHDRVVQIPKQCEEFVLGDNDLKLMQNLNSAGVEHRTFARMIQVWVTIDAPLYWWKEMDRYTVGKTQVSCSTMHKIHAKEFELDDFSHEHLISVGVEIMNDYIIPALNSCREIYLDFDHLHEEGMLSPEITCKKDVWWQMIQLLPSSYNQKRTINLNYEVCMKIWKERHNHKLDEWHTLCDFIMGLPFMKDIMKVGE